MQKKDIHPGSPENSTQLINSAERAVKVHCRSQWLKCANMDYLSKVNEIKADETSVIKQTTNKCQDIDYRA